MVKIKLVCKILIMYNYMVFISLLEDYTILRPILHYFLHFIFPGIIGYIFFRSQWKKAWLIMIATMLVDLDHLLAYPNIYDPLRCSIGFHPLHTVWAMIFYALFVFHPKLRIWGVGLLLHMATDWIDCLSI